MTGVLRVILAVTMGVATCRETFGQMTVYTVSDLSAGGVPSRLNNFGDVAGKADDSSSGETLASIWHHGRFRGPKHLGQSIWVSFTAANLVPLRRSTMREKSLERRILLTRSFHLSGRLGAAFARVRCWEIHPAMKLTCSVALKISSPVPMVCRSMADVEECY